MKPLELIETYYPQIKLWALPTGEVKIDAPYGYPDMVKYIKAREKELWIELTKKGQTTTE